MDAARPYFVSFAIRMASSSVLNVMTVLQAWEKKHTISTHNNTNQTRLAQKSRLEQWTCRWSRHRKWWARRNILQSQPERDFLSSPWVKKKLSRLSCNLLEWAWLRFSSLLQCIEEPFPYEFSRWEPPPSHLDQSDPFKTKTNEFLPYSRLILCSPNNPTRVKLFENESQQTIFHRFVHHQPSSATAVFRHVPKGSVGAMRRNLRKKDMVDTKEGEGKTIKNLFQEPFFLQNWFKDDLRSFPAEFECNSLQIGLSGITKNLFPNGGRSSERDHWIIFSAFVTKWTKKDKAHYRRPDGERALVQQFLQGQAPRSSSRSEDLLPKQVLQFSVSPTRFAAPVSPQPRSPWQEQVRASKRTWERWNSKAKSRQPH